MTKREKAFSADLIWPEHYRLGNAPRETSRVRSILTTLDAWQTMDTPYLNRRGGRMSAPEHHYSMSGMYILIEGGGLTSRPIGKQENRDQALRAIIERRMGMPAIPEEQYRHYPLAYPIIRANFGLMDPEEYLDHSIAMREDIVALEGWSLDAEARDRLEVAMRDLASQRDQVIGRMIDSDAFDEVGRDFERYLNMGSWPFYPDYGRASNRAVNTRLRMDEQFPELRAIPLHPTQADEPVKELYSSLTAYIGKTRKETIDIFGYEFMLSDKARKTAVEGNVIDIAEEVQYAELPEPKDMNRSDLERTLDLLRIHGTSGFISGHHDVGTFLLCEYVMAREELPPAGWIEEAYKKCSVDQREYPLNNLHDVVENALRRKYIRTSRPARSACALLDDGVRFIHQHRRSLLDIHMGVLDLPFQPKRMDRSLDWPEMDIDGVPADIAWLCRKINHKNLSHEFAPQRYGFFPEQPMVLGGDPKDTLSFLRSTNIALRNRSRVLEDPLPEGSNKIEKILLHVDDRFIIDRLCFGGPIAKFSRKRLYDLENAEDARRFEAQYRRIEDLVPRPDLDAEWRIDDELEWREMMDRLKPGGMPLYDPNEFDMDDPCPGF